MLGKNKNINISHMLNYYGSNLTIEEKSDGTVEVLMDGKITTVGANTTVRDGTAAFRLKAGTEYIVPTYDDRGEIKSGGSLAVGEDYIELKWDNAFDTLRTIGGFLIDLKYGILGKIENSDGSESYDIISFGGGLDLGFMTPGGAAKARQNKKDGDKWEEIGVYYVDVDKGTVEKEEDIEIPPKNSRPSRVEGGATIHDVLYGGKTPGYLGINMNARVSLPQIVSFLPNKIEGNLDINTIGGYRVGIEGKVKTATMEMQLVLVIKSNPSGAPIPDKLYFTVGGFEPGINVDSVGVLWITGGGGGFDKLYESIYGKDGLPPITLLLHIEFDITKILTGSADLELSLRSISISFDDLSLKKLEDAKFVDGGIIAIGWYPNFSFNLRAGVNYLQILKGSLQITAGAGGDTKAFFEMVLRVALRLPKIIPVVGGMEIASAELGGGTEKVWGNITLLEIIKVGFVYYWGGDVEFTAGNAGGSESFGYAPGGGAIAFADAGERRSFALFKAMTAPRQIGTDPVTGESQFVAVGSNLNFVAGSKAADNFEEKVAQAMTPAGRTKMFAVTPTEIFTNSKRTSHLVQFGETADYILTISSVDRSELTKEYLQNHMTVKQNGSPYSLNYYVAPAEGSSDAEKEAALKNANVNITGSIANIIIPKTHLGTNKNFLIEFNDGKAYDVGAIYVDPVSELTTCSSSLSGNSLTVNWTGENISDTANIIVSISDVEGQDGVILNTHDIPAKYAGEKGTAALVIPDKMASGTYYVTLTISDEEKCFKKHDAGSITVINGSAPGTPTSVTLNNAGDDKLRVSITPADGEDIKLKGYFVDVYEGDIMADAGLYFDKDDDILIGGRYEVPVMDENGEPTGESVTVGYTPGKNYRVKVRAGNITDPDEDVDGDEIYYCSSYIESAPVALVGSTPPKINIAYDKAVKNIIVTSDVPVTGELYINRGIADGKWYEFDTMSKIMTQNIDLPDGNHTLEFHALDGEGDHAIVQQIINIDTTPPTFMIETPISGSAFSGSIIVKGTGDPDAAYTFKLNGVKKNPIESDIFETGLLNCTLPVGNMKSSAKIDLEIIAEDEEGNASKQAIELTNKGLAEINSITVYSDNTPAAEGKIDLEKSKTAELRLMGTAAAGISIDITDSPATRMEIFGGNSVSLKGNEITGVDEGQTMLGIRYDLGGGRVVRDGVIIDVANSKDDDSGDEDDKEGSEDNDGRDDRPKEPDKTKEPSKSSPTSPDTKWENTFKDINTADWFYTAVEYVCSKGLFNGIGDGSFSPELPMTRGMMAAVMWRMAGTPANQGKNPFNDLKADWYRDAVLWANENKIVSGYGNGVFSPDDDITREQIAVMLYRFAANMGYNTALRGNLNSYTDGKDISDWAVDAMSWASGEGFITGRGNKDLAPKDKAIRAEIAAILYRFMGKYTEN